MAEILQQCRAGLLLLCGPEIYQIGGGKATPKPSAGLRVHLSLWPARLTVRSVVRGLVLSVGIFVLLVPPASAWYPRLSDESLVRGPLEGSLVGRNRAYYTGRGETLMEVARRAGLGYQALVQANPGIDPWQPGSGTQLVLPYAAVLPTQLQQPGITINLAEYRLYLVWREDEQLRVRIYPIGLGREGWLTPVGLYQVESMIDDPLWTMPEAMRQNNPEMPRVVPPGPDNPLGRHWIGLSLPGYGIHGTNRPYGIGRRVSHGCVRLYPRDIADLIGRVERGMAVKVIYQPIKLGRQGDRLLLEAHPDYQDSQQKPLGVLETQAELLAWDGVLPQPLVAEILSERRGVPRVLVPGKPGPAR